MSESFLSLLTGYLQFDLLGSGASQLSSRMSRSFYRSEISPTSRIKSYVASLRDVIMYLKYWIKR